MSVFETRGADLLGRLTPCHLRQKDLCHVRGLIPIPPGDNLLLMHELAKQFVWHLDGVRVTRRGSVERVRPAGPANVSRMSYLPLIAFTLALLTVLLSIVPDEVMAYVPTAPHSHHTAAWHDVVTSHDRSHPCAGDTNQACASCFLRCMPAIQTMQSVFRLPYRAEIPVLACSLSRGGQTIRPIPKPPMPV